jgi:Mn2+/Fe2+ NRAMP family transporter
MKNWLSSLGPGLLYAGAAVGVSHVVQSTRAGALYGFGLVGFVLLVNLLKYPFFSYASRYARHSGKDLIEGYGRMHPWVLPAFLILTVATMFPILVAITAVFTGIVQFLAFPNASAIWISGISLFTCALLLGVGRYAVLDRGIKIIMLLLVITTLLALAFAFGEPLRMQQAAAGSFIFDKAGWVFLLAFAGWMPTPIDASVWQSMWTVAKREKQFVTDAQMRFDFRLGYHSSMVLAVFFVILGGVVLYGNGSLPEGGAAFAGAFVNLYVELLGSWSFPVIAICVFVTIFSTLLTVMDAYPRVLARALNFYQPSKSKESGFDEKAWKWLIWIFAAGSFLILLFLKSSMLALVDFATILSFLSAPILAWWNMRLLHQHESAAEFRPEKFMQWWAWLGLAFLVVMNVLYLWFR